jgi:hypothetical protein
MINTTAKISIIAIVSFAENGADLPGAAEPERDGILMRLLRNSHVGIKITAGLINTHPDLLRMYGNANVSIKNRNKNNPITENNSQYVFLKCDLNILIAGSSWLPHPFDPVLVKRLS